MKNNTTNYLRTFYQAGHVASARVATIFLLFFVLMSGCREDLTGGMLDTWDVRQPVAGTISPACDATGVALNQVLTSTFADDLEPSSVNTSSVGLTAAGGTQVSGTVAYNAEARVVTFTPSSPLSPSTSYTYTISGGENGIKDLFGNLMPSGFVCTFTTGLAPDTTPPTVIATDPENNETGVMLNSRVTATFSEAVDPLTVNASSFLLSGPESSPIAGSVTYAGPSFTAVFFPTDVIAANTTYTATITTGATDVVGNALVANFVWSFTTGEDMDMTRPEVTSTDPQDLETDVATNTDVTATFSEEMDPLTITGSSFTLEDGVGPVDGSVSYLGTTATFNPTNDLNANTTYTATITMDATDLDGNPLQNDFVWTFTTAGMVVTGPMVVNLTCAEGFATVGGAGISSTGPSIINGDVALSPGSSLIGFPPGIINGTTHINNTTANDVQGCLTSAFNDAAGRAPGASVSGNIGGLTLAPGVYTAGSGLAVSSGNLTLDAQGDANGVFIFQIPSTFTMTSGLQIILAGGAQAKNVFWQVGTSATIGTNAVMMGTIMADQSITLETGAVLNGAALARIAAITLDSATINVQ